LTVLSAAGNSGWCVNGQHSFKAPRRSVAVNHQTNMTGGEGSDHLAPCASVCTCAFSNDLFSAHKSENQSR